MNNLNYNNSDTIVAISTPLGKSGIGIVRLSGEKAIEIVDKIFISKNKKSAKNFKSHTIHYGFIVEKSSANIIDEVLLTIMKAPKTYTRQDIVEINCHGGIAAVRKVLELCLENGARLAQPGEFTLRAYLNGRIDLAQAEAVLDIVDASTEKALKASTSQLRGELSQLLGKVKENLLEVLSEIEANIDFPEEEIEISEINSLKEKIIDIKNTLQKLLISSQMGKLLYIGVKGVICGRPNVGKSSLMNALLGKERVIVTPSPGTTRDVIEEIIDLDGIPLRILDTAGIIEPKDLIEKESVNRSKDEIEQADIIIFVLDATQGFVEEDKFIYERIKNKNFIICLNKIDIGNKIEIESFPISIRERFLKVSALKKIGIDELKRKIHEIVISQEIDLSFPILINVRHQLAVKNAVSYLQCVLDNLRKNFGLEIIAQDLKESLDEISSILGENINDKVLDLIFSRFCIGK
jgi:tRNA modification GTPase